MSKTIKCIISVVFGLTLLFAANLTASAEIYPASVTKYGTSKEIQFTSETLYYRNSADSTESETASWNAKYDPANNTLYLRNYKGGKIKLIGRTKTAQPKLQFSGTMKYTSEQRKSVISDLNYLHLSILDISHRRTAAHLI